MFSLQSAIKKLLEKNVDEPDNMDCGFIVSHEMTGSTFNFLVSSLRLLANSVNAKTICADATHRLFHGNNATTTFGKIRENGRMDLIAISVSSNAHSCYEYAFTEIQTAAEKYFGAAMCPSALICDFDDICNAFSTVFGRDATILIPPEKMEMTVRRKLRTLVPQQQQHQISEDMKYLRISQDIETFERDSSSFAEKYSDFKGFMAFFNSDWLQFKRNWLKVSSSSINVTVRTNNGQESFHRVLKENLVHSHFPLEICINRMIECVTKFSYEQITASSELFPKLKIKV